LEPEIVSEGDSGSVAWMEKTDMPYTQRFSSIVDTVVEMTG
jgi:hypothetical protein